MSSGRARVESGSRSSICTAPDRGAVRGGRAGRGARRTGPRCAPAAALGLYPGAWRLLLKLDLLRRGGQRRARWLGLPADLSRADPAAAGCAALPEAAVARGIGRAGRDGVRFHRRALRPRRDRRAAGHDHRAAGHGAVYRLAAAFDRHGLYRGLRPRSSRRRDGGSCRAADAVFHPVRGAPVRAGRTQRRPAVRHRL